MDCSQLVLGLPEFERHAHFAVHLELASQSVTCCIRITAFDVPLSQSGLTIHAGVDARGDAKLDFASPDLTMRHIYRRTSGQKNFHAGSSEHCMRSSSLGPDARIVRLSSRPSGGQSV